MKKRNQSQIVLLAGFFFGVILMGPLTARAEASGEKAKFPDGGFRPGVYLHMTRDFYEALKQEGQVGTTVYSNQMSTEYLRQIAISARFMVESNFQILKQQERIIELLQAQPNAKKR